MKKVKSFLAGTLVLVVWALSLTAQNSVLSTGDWYKISTDEYGIYKIGYTDLQDFGIDPDEINPKFIRLFGNGNGMLPEDPEAPRYDDLQEIAIVVFGEDDEVFNPEDHILFYGEGPTEWQLNTETGYFGHETNLYTDRVCYFLNIGETEGARIETQYSTIIPHNYTSNSYHDYYVHELEMVNLIHSGKKWFGEELGDNPMISFDFTLSGLVLEDSIHLRAGGAARSSEQSSLLFKINANPVLSLSFPSVSYTNPASNFARSNENHASFLSDNTEIELIIEYSQPNDSSTAWLDFFTMNFKRSLSFNNEQIIFRDPESAGTGNITRFEISGSNGDFLVWNITDPIEPKKVDFQFGAGTAAFTLETDSLLEFVAAGENQYMQASFEGVIPNQNLHGLESPGLLIVTAEEFQIHAQQLADFRESNNDLSTLVTTPQEIYNEFSSGVQDVTAIRDFAKYMYEKDTLDGLKYLLLFGKASYDYKNITESNTNFVPVHETWESLNPISSACTDDYYGYFDNSPYLRLGIGRIPVKSADEGENCVQKLMKYETEIETTGNWRNDLCLIADDEDVNLHFAQLEQISQITDTTNSSINQKKIYLDAYPQMTDSSGAHIYPDVNEAITERINHGVLLLDYAGHGNHEQLAAEKILTPVDLTNWNNSSFFPFFLCATSDMNKFDEPEIISLGEQMVLMDNKGMIAVFAPTRPTYASPNYMISKEVIARLISDKQSTTGDIIKTSKNITGLGFNSKKYTLFGDPSMKLAIPQYEIQTLTINGIPAIQFSDTIAPGQELTIAGVITDNNGNPLNDFNGEIVTTVYDKPEVQSTHGNDPESTPAEFTVQETILTEVTTGVSAGSFEVTITLPQNLSEDYGYLKISHYAHDGLTDAQGHYSEIIAGGLSSGTGEHSMFGDIKIYPSPACNRIFVETGEFYSRLKIEIITPNGEVLQSVLLNDVKTTHREELDITEFGPGLYLLRITDGVQSAGYKVIKE